MIKIIIDMQIKRYIKSLFNSKFDTYIDLKSFKTLFFSDFAYIYIN